MDAKMRRLRFLWIILVVINSTVAQCPWQKDIPDLQTACLCAYNLAHELSVQCDQVNSQQCVNVVKINNNFSSNFINRLSFRYYWRH